MLSQLLQQLETAPERISNPSLCVTTPHENSPALGLSCTIRCVMLIWTSDEETGFFFPPAERHERAFYYLDRPDDFRHRLQYYISCLAHLDFWHYTQRNSSGASGIFLL